MRIKRARLISLEKLIWNNRVRKRINKRLTIGMLIFLLSFFALFHAWQSLSPSLQNPAFQKQFHLIGNVISEFSGEPSIAQINVDFNDEVGRVREDFYGANTHGPSALITSVDSAWMQDKWLSAKMGNQRVDQNLDSFFSGPYNFDFEVWKNTSATKLAGSSSIEMAIGWNINWQFSDGSAYQTTDSHSGVYALQVNSTSIPNHSMYIERGGGIGDLFYGNFTSYNISFWAKGQGYLKDNIQDISNGYANSCIWNNKTLTPTWKLYSSNCTTNSSSHIYRYTIDVYGNATIDDFNIVQMDGTPLPSYWLSTNAKTSIINWQRLFNFINSSNGKIVIITSYMPKAFANFSSPWCNASDSHYPSRCPANNYDTFGRANRDWFSYVTNNGTIYADILFDEIWNEPEIFFWLDMLSTDDIIKATEYVKMYNASDYYMNQSFSNIPVGGPATAGDTCTNGQNKIMMKTFLSNASVYHYNIDFLSGHCYSDSISSNMLAGTTNLFALCNSYGLDCSPILWDEWNIGSVTEKNISSNYAKFGIDVANVYTNIFNNYPENTSSFLYQWWAGGLYGPLQSEYPQKWQMVSPPSLDNETMASYDVTKNFATYHSAGSMIVRSNSSLNSIKVVASEKDGSQYITVINAGNETDVSLILSGNSYSNVKDLETNEIYVPNNGLINIGVLDKYEIKYLINTNEIPTQNIPATPSSGGYSGGGGGGSSSNSKINANDVYNTENNSNEDIDTYQNMGGNNQEENSGKTAGTGKAILGEGEKYVSGVIVLLVIGIIAVLISVLTILYFRNRRNNLGINSGMQDLKIFKEGKELEGELEKYGLERDDLEKDELEEEGKEGEGEREMNKD